MPDLFRGGRDMSNSPWELSAVLTEIYFASPEDYESFLPWQESWNRMLLWRTMVATLVCRSVSSRETNILCSRLAPNIWALPKVKQNDLDSNIFFPIPETVWSVNVFSVSNNYFLKETYSLECNDCSEFRALKKSFWIHILGCFFLPDIRLY